MALIFGKVLPEFHSPPLLQLLRLLTKEVHFIWIYKFIDSNRMYMFVYLRNNSWHPMCRTSMTLSKKHLTSINMTNTLYFLQPLVICTHDWGNLLHGVKSHVWMHDTNRQGDPGVDKSTLLTNAFRLNCCLCFASGSGSDSSNVRGIFWAYIILVFPSPTGSILTFFGLSSSIYSIDSSNKMGNFPVVLENSNKFTLKLNQFICKLAANSPPSWLQVLGTKAKGGTGRKLLELLSS